MESFGNIVATGIMIDSAYWDLITASARLETSITGTFGIIVAL